MRALLRALVLAAASLLPLSLFALEPFTLVVDEEVDLIELNHFYDEHGQHVLDQMLFYDWCGSDGRFHVQAWRLLKRSAQVPVYSWHDRCFIATWHDGGVLRVVRSLSFRETWTQHDPELRERAALPPKQRRDLCLEPGAEELVEFASIVTSN